MPHPLHHRQAGLTLVELIIVTAIGSLIIATISVFITRGFIVSRSQFEQTRTTEDARLQIQRIADTIRNASQIDCNGDGFTDGTNENWLLEATDTSITIYANVDQDAAFEKVRYYLDPGTTNLKQEVYKQSGADCAFAASPTTTTVLTDIHNEASNTPIFAYYGSASPTASPLNLPLGEFTGIKVIRIHLIVDVNQNQDPGPINISTDVTPRTVVCDSANCGQAATYQCTEPVDGDKLYTEPYASDTSVQDTFYACQDYCKTNLALDQSQCCGWSVNFYDSYDIHSTHTLDMLCSCTSSAIPDGLNRDPVSSIDNYTDYVKQCLDGTYCKGPAGKPYCEPACLNAPGVCGCDCGQ